MNLRILLPFRIFADASGVKRVVAESTSGSFGLLPHRLDCVAALVPGILTYEAADGTTLYVAIDEGVLVKTGAQVRVSVRQAVGGTDLGRLHDAVRQEFLAVDEQQRDVRAAVARIEGGLMRRLAEFDHA